MRHAEAVGASGAEAHLAVALEDAAPNDDVSPVAELSADAVHILDDAVFEHTPVALEGHGPRLRPVGRKAKPNAANADVRALGRPDARADRGFHVRPSTLIAKLVLHYGSEVKMILGSETYDATMPLELFRANEKINAEKRRWLASEIVRLRLVPEDTNSDDFASLARGVVLALAERGKLIMYEQPLLFPEDPAARDGTVLDRAVAEVARLLALGKIDIELDIKVTFRGDTRVLADIGLLAEMGYGEDKFGNNIPLPEKLKYLRR